MLTEMILAWQAINVHTPILQLVAKINSRVFVGLELSQNVEWVSMSPGLVTQDGVHINTWDT